MPRPSQPPYECPACGNSINNRAYMRNHFYKLKNPCPKIANDIDLTDEVKQYVLANRKWHFKKPVDEFKTININNQNNTIINNFIASIDPEFKISKVIEHKGVELVSLDDKIEEMYRNQVHKLENNAYKYGYELKQEDLLNIIDEVSQTHSENIHEMNIIYDDNGKKIKLYNGEWKSLRIKCAIKEILQAVKDNYLDSYETFLIKKVINITTGAFQKQKTNELIDDYYKFLSYNDFNYPYVSSCIDFDDDVKDRFQEKYKKIFDDVTNAQKSKMFKEIVDIVTRNSKNNIKELNKKITSLFKMDLDFKNIMMTEINNVLS